MVDAGPVRKREKHAAIKSNICFSYEGETNEYIELADVITLTPSSLWAWLRLTHAKMHNNTHWDESDTRVRWPLCSQLSHRWRHRWKSSFASDPSSSTSEWISLPLCLFYDDRLPYGESLARNTDALLEYCFSPLASPFSLSAIPLRLQANLSLCTLQTGDALALMTLSGEEVHEFIITVSS